MSDDAIATTILHLLGQRAATSSICPSDAARALSSEEPVWRALMPRVRSAALALMQQGRVGITRRGVPLAAKDVEGGPIRLVRGPDFDKPA